ncbi:hypothetical protein PoB_000289400 [Plakobranchus ocellatus]|uniref:Uncharacterized protein n=1 Tax=Plakobranchus ocellatus TaxID=259542 RepID=A0AAV3Y2Y6_9GAST|nr:hypothetical protein PoB_000289400 [Plakobranchus ocellatus]
MRHRADPDRATSNHTGIDTIWRSLGRLRAELRKMDHRLDGVAETATATTTTPTTGAGSNISNTTTTTTPRQQQQRHRVNLSGLGGGTMPGVSSAGDQGSDAAKRTTGVSANHTGARRKVNRLDEKLDDSRHQSSRRAAQHKSSAGGGGNGGCSTGYGGSRSREPVRANHLHNQQQQQHNNAQVTAPGIREDSPKRVDFSKTHQLREVNWDGTYQDSLAYPADVTNSTVTNSRDIRDTNINFLNFSRVPGAAHPSSLSSHPPPPSVSSSSSSSTAAAPRGSSSRGGETAALNSNNNARYTGSSSPPYPPPPSVSNSSVNCHGLVLPSAVLSASSTSVMSEHHSREQQQQQHHQQHAINSHQPAPSSSSSSSATDQQQQPPPDVRWATQASATRSSSSSSSPPAKSDFPGNPGVSASPSPASKGKDKHGPKLAHVDLKIVHGSRSSSAPTASSRSSGHDQRQPQPHPSQDSNHIRRHVEEKWALSKNNNRFSSTDTYSSSSNRRTGADRDEGAAAPREDLVAPPGAVGGAPVSLPTGDTGEMYSPRRPRPIKKAITADLKEDGE